MKKQKIEMKEEPKVEEKLEPKLKKEKNLIKWKINTFINISDNTD